VKRGFTLVEVIVTFAIITGGMVALLMAFSSALGISGNIEEEDTAIQIADATMDGLKNTKYANLQGFTKESGALFSNLTGYTVTVTTTKPANPAQIDVIVSWVGKGGAANVTLTTLAADY
jgi:prepilin-type N-terminal cleavage/methylation domain-containing protein